jgi:drug/metabolite transporter (DMT)-like permease
MAPARTLLLTTFAMLAFASNSLLCRIALAQTAIDPATFTTVRVLGGAAALLLIIGMQRKGMAGGWREAFALFAYAAAFSFAYVSLPAGTGAVLLFGAVQVTMIGSGLWRGERLSLRRLAGFACAFAGIVGLMLPGLSAPPLFGAVLMVAAGVAWGIFSVLGKSAGDPVAVIAGSFVRASPCAIVLSALLWPTRSLDSAGIGYALLSGGLTSGVGYVIWYTALRGLTVTGAAAVQLTVPVIAALGGVALLGEAVSLRLLLASVAILGGVALALSRG